VTILVTDGDQRSALAIVRALGRRGISVIVGEAHRASLAGQSRYCAQQIVYPSPYTDGDAFEAFLLDRVRRGDIDVLMPVTDVTTSLVCRHQDALRCHTRLAVPGLDAFNLVTDKATLVESAKRRGIPVPPTLIVNGRKALARAIDRVQFPAVVKPTRSRIPTPTGWVPGRVEYARDADELETLYGERSYLASYPSLIQPRIVGPGVGFFGLFDRGRLIARFAHRRLREKPPSGGVSVFRESVPIDERLERHAISLLGSIGWHGVAMMEYKQDRRSGECVLMEVNGRFWGSLQLAVDAGIDFPWLVAELAHERPVARVPGYRSGVRSRWLLGDLDHLLLRLFRRNAALDLVDDAPSRLRTCVDFLRFRQSDLHYEVLSREDMRPFLHELGQYVGSLTSRLTNPLRSRLRATRRPIAKVSLPPRPSVPRPLRSRLS